MQHKNHSPEELEVLANKIRQDVVQMLLDAGSGHSAGSLGTADIFTALYFSVLNVKPREPDWIDRDRFVLSAGHLCPVWYATLAHAGFFEHSELKTLRKLGSRLQGHPHNLTLPGVETSSGPLGQGLSQACGMALAAKMDGKDYFVYALLSDGEQQSGQTWEAVMFAGKNRMHNLTAIIDRNNIQIDGFTEDVMTLEPLKEKYEAFNWYVIDVDGHDISGIIEACHEAKAVFEKPVVIIAHTIPGRGVEFMERDFKWHGKSPGGKQTVEALRELRTLKGKIEVHDLT